MIIWPLRPVTATPSTSRLTRSWLMRASVPAGSRGAPRWIVDQAASAVVDHVLELVAVVLQEALHRPRRGVTEGADRVALDAVRDVEQQVEVRALGLPGQDLEDQPVHPAGALAAGRALAAGLGAVEARDALEHLDHAGRVVHDDHRAGAEGRARLAQRVVVHRGADDRL